MRRGRDPLLAFVATLGYSRASFVRFTVAEDAITLCTCLREALSCFGGVPAHVLLDNASTMVTAPVIHVDRCDRGRPTFF